MTVVVVAVGSTGDVLPLLAVGRRLREDGVDVDVATHAPYYGLVADHGLGFRPLPMDPRDLLTEEVAAKLRRGGLAAGRAVASEFEPWVEPLVWSIDEHLADAEVAVLSTLAWPSVHSAAGRGVPSLLVHLQPMHPTREFAPPAFSMRSAGPLNALLGRLVLREMVRPQRRLLDRLRARHGLPAMSVADQVRHLATQVPASYAFSRHVVSPPTDWPAAAEVVGYLDLGVEPGWAPDPQLEEFLAQGPAVAIGFGSTAPADRAALADLVGAALELADVRAVVQSGWVGLELDGPRAHTVGTVPHGWLYPRLSAVVHHAGAGTTAATLRAGVPSVPVPVALDQGFWARRLHQHGAAPAPVPARRLTAPALAAAIVEAVGEGSYAGRARALQARLAEEDAAGAIAARVLRLLG